MIGLDTNIIVHLLVRSQAEHERTKAWMEKADASFVTTTTNVAETLRLLTHPKVFPKPASLASAVDSLEELLSARHVRVLEEEERWWAGLPELAKKIPTLKGNEIFDARVALCLRYNGVREICTFDTDFAKYPFLKVVLP